MLSVYSLLHVLSAIIWVGGMFFAYNFLRPAVGQLLEPPQRLSLWVGVFNRFFPFVWVSIILLPLTGYLMVFTIWGGFDIAPLYVHIMNGLGIIMILIFMHVYFSSFKRLSLAVEEQRWPDAGKALAHIRVLVGINTYIGIIVVVVVSAGRFLA